MALGIRVFIIIISLAIVALLPGFDGSEEGWVAGRRMACLDRRRFPPHPNLWTVVGIARIYPTCPLYTKVSLGASLDTIHRREGSQ